MKDIMNHIMECLAYIPIFLENESVIKLAIAALIGIIIGFERELKHKPAGIKTAMIITIGSCLLTIVSIHSAEILSEAYTKPMDPLRLAAQIVSGIGFLGGGVILHQKNDVISGITTAAIIWVAGAIGIAVGAGFYTEAIIALVFIILAVEFLPKLIKKAGPRQLKEKEIRVKLYIEKQVDLTTLIKEIKGKELKIKGVKVKEEANNILLSCIVISEKHHYTTDVYYVLKSLEGIVQAEVENLE